MFLHLTTLLNLDKDPIGTVDAQFVGGARTNTWLVVATTPDNTGEKVDLYPYGPFATSDDARAWAEAHLTPYSTYTVAPLAAPYTNADIEAEIGKPLRHCATAPPARADTIARLLKSRRRLTHLRHTTPADTTRHGFTAHETEHPDLGPVVELTALGPDREVLHRDMSGALRYDPRYDVTDQHTHLLVRRRSAAELHAHADRAAARVTPHITALTAP